MANSGTDATGTPGIQARAPGSPVRVSLVGSAASVVTAVLSVLVLQWLPLIVHEGFSIDRLRAYYSFDQWGYLAYVINVAGGTSGSLEPDTETGSNFYPNGYYVLLGLIARWTGAEPVVVWNLAGLVVLALVVAVVAAVLIWRGGRAWYGVLAAAPFLVGTLSWMVSGGWNTPLASHAVLWGPFAVAYTINGEAQALAVAAASIVVLYALWCRPTRPAARIVGSLVVAVAIGSLANVQTYSFLTAVYLCCYVIAATVLIRKRRIVLMAVSAALLPVLFVAGPIVHDVGGQLATLVFGLLPAIPGLIVGILDSRGFLALALSVSVLAASPQVIRTAQGIITEDPFLVYRVASNSDLGVGVVQGVLGGLVLLVPLLFIGLAALRLRVPLWGGYVIGAGLCWAVLATNDRWGANAEPYRLWIDAMYLIAFSLPIVIVDVLRRARELRAIEEAAKSAAPVESAASVADPTESPESKVRGIPAPMFAVAVSATVLVFVLGAVDAVRFAFDTSVHGVTESKSDVDLAAARLAQQAETGDSGLVLSDSCIDPRYLKVNSGVPVAFYHPGMAWPTAYEAVAEVVSARNTGELDAATARDAGVTHVVTRSDCGDGWSGGDLDGLERVASDRVDAAGREVDVTVWRLAAG